MLLVGSWCFDLTSRGYKYSSPDGKNYKKGLSPDVMGKKRSDCSPDGGKKKLRVWMCRDD